eukprot:CAMPEP_0119353698 /NCGR_PEP_ID=MMETSP1334-20130426/2804_1 /TAXON_ID=127549 /ORGANISM="Calcidiscus leptoporus, Strain RCC1130" /LENGTH=176 /DNA_ID=CAMNT_0007367045 /DNA_START=13 /DNA_END=543 /DNA_ORIENTATION=+
MFRILLALLPLAAAWHARLVTLPLAAWPSRPSPLVSRQHAVCPRPTRAALTLQEFPSQPEVAEEERVDRSEAQQDVIARAQDPFRAVRIVVFAIFGIVGLAGCGIALTQLGSDPAGALGNLAVNAGFLGAAAALYVFDQKVQADLRAKLEEELANPYLKGGSEFYFDENDTQPPLA